MVPKFGDRNLPSLRSKSFVPVPSLLMQRSSSVNKKVCIPRCVSRADFSLAVYLVTDRRTHPDFTLTHIVEEAVKGGVTMVQLRDKDVPYLTSLQTGTELRRITREHNVAFIVNDSIRLAKDLQADGVHLGQDDAPVAEARSVLGERAIIGVSAGDIDEAEKALAWGADYLGVGAVFGTKTKGDAGDAIGVDGLARVVNFVDGKVPIVAIGGVDVENADKCREAGAQGVAVVSAIMKSEQPGAVASELRRIMKEGATVV